MVFFGVFDRRRRRRRPRRVVEKGGGRGAGGHSRSANLRAESRPFQRSPLCSRLGSRRESDRPYSSFTFLNRRLQDGRPIASNRVLEVCQVKGNGRRVCDRRRGGGGGGGGLDSFPFCR